MFKNTVKNWTTNALREKVRQLYPEARLSLAHRKAVKKAKKFQGASNLRLHLGCGHVRKAGWVNIDLYSDDSDLQLDLREPWPFGNCSVSFIYSEHLFEHFEYPIETGKLLSEARRVLVPGGRFSLGIPDFEFAIRSYLTRDEEFHRREREAVPRRYVTTPMDFLNHTFRQFGEHKYAYDFETLTKVLTDAGFISVATRPFDPALDSTHREWGSLYAEAVKP